jgi:hypothetical protein
MKELQCIKYDGTQCLFHSNPDALVAEFAPSLTALLALALTATLDNWLGLALTTTLLKVPSEFSRLCSMDLHNLCVLALVGPNLMVFSRALNTYSIKLQHYAMACTCLRADHMFADQVLF